MSVAVTAPRATLADLARADGKAELVGGCIFRRLAEYADVAGRGVAYTDNMGFAVPELSTGREPFSPDAAYHTGPLPARPMRFVEGPSDFAAEVRSEGDSGPAAEATLAARYLRGGDTGRVGR